MQSLIGTASMVPEIIRKVSKDPPGPLNGEKPGLNRLSDKTSKIKGP